MIWKELTSRIQGHTANLVKIKAIDEDQKIVIAEGLYQGEIPESEEDEQPTIVGGNGLYWFYEGKEKNIPFADITDEEILILNPPPEEIEE